LIALIEIDYSEASQQREQTTSLLAILKGIYMPQQWYWFSNPAMEEVVIEVHTMWRIEQID
jgi:hypothetical protein